MSWRFRKTFKVLPGVRLNLTARGLSATIGAAPFSVNVGPRGVYSNIGIPGTGIWTRERLDDPSGHQATFEPTPPTGLRDPHPAPVADATNPLRPRSTEIRSASTESLGSDSMARLSALLKETYDEREALAVDISVAESELTIAARRGGGVFLCLQAGGVFDNPEALDTFRMDNKWSISAPLASNGICNPLRINVESTSCVRRYNIGVGAHYAMPIYEYLCADCGTKFEKLIRRSTDTDTLVCPSCGQQHLQQELSTFSAHANGASKSADMPTCPSGGRCPTPGMCGMN